MGCSTGACGVPQRRFSDAPARREGPCCQECADDEIEQYRSQFMTALSPWGARHAGKVLSEEGTLVGGGSGGGNYNDPSASTSASTATGTKTATGDASAAWQAAGEIGTHIVDAARDLGQTAITERERTARAQAGYGADGVMPDQQSTTRGINDASGASSGGNDMTPLLILGLAAAGAAALSKGSRR